MTRTLKKPPAHFRQQPDVAPPNEVELVAKADFGSGYRTLSKQIERALQTAGVDVSVHPPYSYFEEYLPYREPDVELVEIETPEGEVVKRYVNHATGRDAKFGTRARRWAMEHPLTYPLKDARLEEPGDRDAVRLAVSLPEGADYDGADKRLLFTMWESTEVPGPIRPWHPHLRRANTVLVPSRHSRRVIKDATPDVVTRYVPLVTEKERWPLMSRFDRTDDDPFIFLCYGDLSVRKGFHILLDAFWRAFGDRRDVLLVLKTRGGSDFCQIEREDKYQKVLDSEGRGTWVNGQPLMEFNKERVKWYADVSPDWPQVRVLRGDWSRKSMLKLLRKADCFVFPSLGEGWGYPPREAAATGLPVILPAHTGMADAERDGWAVCVDYHERAHKAIFRHWGGQVGYYPAPDKTALVKTMQYMVENRQWGYEFGYEASRIVTKRTLRDLGNDLVDQIKSLKRSRR